MIPLSFAQRRLWFLYKLEGPSATYNVPFVLRLTGDLDTAALEAAVRDVVARHESLRTLCFEDEHGRAYQRVLSPAGADLSVPVLDVPAEDVPDTVARCVTHGFDLGAEIPVRVSLLRCGPREHVLVMVTHHIACDGESAAPFARDLIAAYSARREGHAPRLPELPVQYRDYTLWQQDLLGDEDDPDSVAARQLAHWKQELAGVPQPLPLPTDRPRPAVPTHRGGLVLFDIDAELLDRVEKMAADRGATLSMTMQATLAVLLHQLGCGEDLTIGAPIAGRTDAALTDLVGFFANTWVARLDLSGNPTFAQLLEQSRTKALAAYDNQDVPFERLVELLNPERSVSYHPLFQVMCAWQIPWPELDLPGLKVAFEPTGTGTAKFDLFFNMVPDRSGAATVRLEYATDLFDRETVEALGARFVRVLRRVADDPEARVASVDVLDPAERERLFGALPGADAARRDPGATVPALFARQAAATPDAVAVVCDEVSLTYRELDARSDRMAARLVRRGAGPESVVALALPRTAELVVALLAVLKSGAAYLPADPRYPSARLEFTLADARPRLVLTDRATAAGLPLGELPVALLEELTAPQDAQEPGGPADGDGGGEFRAPRLLPDHPAYVMYTSGSTGVPKGAVVPHRTVVDDVTALVARLGVEPGWRMPAGTSVNFDVSAFEIFATLLSGGSVEIVRDALVLGERPGGPRGNVLSTVPAVLAELADGLAAHADGIDAVVLGGEAL
ncbi:condensation domain-containing protein, partial [Streptomyces capoamus]